MRLRVVGDIETQLENAANKISGQEDEEHECNKYVRWQAGDAVWRAYRRVKCS